MPAVATTESAKPDAGREAGVDQQQRDDGGAERAGAALAAVGAHREQRDRAHRRRPDHARLGARQQHEADDPRGPDGVQPAPAHPAPPRQDQQEPDHEGEVGAGDGQQVGEPGGAEVVGRGRGRHRRRRRRPAPGRSPAGSAGGRRPTPGSSPRTASAPRHQTSGPASSSGSPRAETTAASPGSSAGESRPVVRSVLPEPGIQPVAVGEHEHRRGQLVGRARAR